MNSNLTKDESEQEDEYDPSEEVAQPATEGEDMSNSANLGGELPLLPLDTTSVDKSATLFVEAASFLDEKVQQLASQNDFHQNRCTSLLV